MKQSHSAVLSWSDRLSIFASRFDSKTTHTYRMERAREQVEWFKKAYTHRSLSFDYFGETIRGKFLLAIDGDFPGTYMVVLRIASSRICSGPCYLRVRGRPVGGIVVTGDDGVVAITAKATALDREPKKALPTWFRGTSKHADGRER